MKLAVRMSGLKSTRERYDLIVFGYLDAHTLISSYSSLRLDNFVYTVESFQEARKLLRDRGIADGNQARVPSLCLREQELVAPARGQSDDRYVAQCLGDLEGGAADAARRTEDRQTPHRSHPHR